MFTVTLVLGILGRSGRSVAGLGRFGVNEVHRTAALTGTDPDRRARDVPLLRPLRPAPAGRRGVPVPGRLPPVLAGPRHARGRPAPGDLPVSLLREHGRTASLPHRALADLRPLAGRAGCTPSATAPTGSSGCSPWPRPVPAPSSPPSAGGSPRRTPNAAGPGRRGGSAHGPHSDAPSGCSRAWTTRPAPRLTAGRAGRPGRGVRADRARRRGIPDRAQDPARSAGTDPWSSATPWRASTSATRTRVLLRTAPGLVLDGLEILASALRARRVLLAVGHRIDPGPVREQVAVRRSPVEVRHLARRLRGRPGVGAGQPARRAPRAAQRPAGAGLGSAASTAGRRWSSTPRPWRSSRCWRATARTGSAASAPARTPAPSWSPSPARPATWCHVPAWSRFRVARRCGTC